MKKILAILCGVTMMFAACTPGGGEEPATPNFPEETTAEVLAGDHYDLKFAANMAWTVSLENDYYATLRYNYENGTEFSGEAAEEVKMEVVIKSDIKNYDEDIVIPVSLTMDNQTNTLVTLTIKKIERPAPIVMNEEFDTITFEENGHPGWGGEFSNAVKKYHLNYSSPYDLEGVSMSCNLEEEYSIKVYAYNQSQSIAETSYITEPWVEVVSGLGTSGNGFKVVMDLSKESAQWSWFETQYESYVNFEDAEGNILISIFCTSTYKPAPSTGGDDTAESIVKMNDCPSTFVSGGHPSWGGEFAGAEIKYALTFADQWDCADGVALKHSLEGVAAYKAYGYNSGFSVQEVNDSYITIDSDYEGGMFVIKMDISAEMAQYSLYEGVGYEGYVNLVDADDNVLASIYCLYNPNAQGGGNTGGDVVALVDADMASAVGVSLATIESTDADYKAGFGSDYGVANVPQYRLTYSQLGALMMPQYAALTISGFAYGQATGAYQINGETCYGYQIFSMWNNPDAGGVVIEPMADNGFTAETIPAGKYEFAAYGGSGAPVARILLDIK